MKRINLAVLSMAAVLCSCSHTYYFPNNQAVPLFTQKNEMQASASIAMRKLSTGVDASAAYAITDNIAATANMSFINQEGHESSSYFEGAIGYYKPINSFLIFETYVGLGRNSQSHYTSYSDGTPDTPTGDIKFNKIFIQPNIGISFRFLDIAYSQRISRINYFDWVNRIDIETADAVEMYHYGRMDNIAHSSPTYLFEPTITLRLGWKWVKVQYQFSNSYCLNNKHLELNNAMFSAGLLFTLGRKFDTTSK